MPDTVSSKGHPNNQSGMLGGILGSVGNISMSAVGLGNKTNSNSKEESKG